MGDRTFLTPFNELFPDLEGHEYESFKASVARHGIRMPVIIDEDDVVIDGRQRLRAAADLGVEPPLEVVDGLSEEEKLDLCLSYNLYRTHYSPKERAQVEAAIRGTTHAQSQ